MADPAGTLSKNQRLFLYFSSLTLLMYAVTPDILLDIPTAYMLKNHLHATASQVSMFRLLTGIPMYVGFVFGLARDLWDPLGLRDRGFFRIFGPLAMVVFCWLAVTRLSYSGLLIGMFLAMISFRFLLAAYSGLVALIGQEELMSGRLSALWMVFRYISFILAYYASGYITEHLSPRQTFFLTAALTLPLCFFGFLKPRVVFSHAYDNPQARGTTFLGDLKRLAKHRAVYPAVAIILLWNFMPGFNTPMQYYLSNQVHAPDSTYANFNCIFYGSYIPIVIAYGFLCTRFPPSKLLWWGAALGIPSMIPLAFIHSGPQALCMAAVMGMMSGIGQCAFYDLAIRSCPPGLQGTLMMMVDSANNLAFRASDVVGTKIYGLNPTYGFLYCVIAMTAVYLFILPVLLLVPKELTATSDGERSPLIDTGTMGELGEATAIP
jgi:MFS family permease